MNMGSIQVQGSYDFIMKGDSEFSSYLESKTVQHEIEIIDELEENKDKEVTIYDLFAYGLKTIS